MKSRLVASENCKYMVRSCCDHTVHRQTQAAGQARATGSLKMLPKIQGELYELRPNMAPADSTL